MKKTVLNLKNMHRDALKNGNHSMVSFTRMYMELTGNHKLTMFILTPYQLALKDEINSHLKKYPSSKRRCVNKRLNKLYTYLYTYSKAEEHIRSSGSNRLHSKEELLHVWPTWSGDGL